MLCFRMPSLLGPHRLPQSREGAANPAAPHSASIVILHYLVLAGIQEENRSCQEGVSESPGCIPGQPGLQGTLVHAVSARGSDEFTATHGTFWVSEFVRNTV